MADETIISTAEELAKRLTLSADLLARADKDWDVGRNSRVRREMSAKDARAVVYESLKQIVNAPDNADGVDQAEDDLRHLARVIVQALPKEAMSPQIVNSMDLRPYLQLVAEQTTLASDLPGAGDGPLLSPQLERIMGADPSTTRGGLLVSTRLTELWQNTVDADIAKGAAPYQAPNQVAALPSATSEVDANGNPVAVDAAGNPVDQRYATTGAGQVNLGDTAYLLGVGMAAVGQLTPEQMAEPVDMGRVPGLTQPTRSSDPRVKSRALPSGTTQNMTSIGGAMDWMYGLSKQEVQQLQQQLETAGYFTLVQYDAQTDQMTWTDVKYEQGYAADSATRAAWYRAISDAKAEGKSISDTLVAKRGEFAARETSAREQMMQARQAEFDKQLGSTRGAADKIAIDTLGRRLTTEEYVRVRQYLRDLQTTRADDLAGRETGDWMTSAPMAGYTQDELAGQVADIAEPEVQQSASLAANRQLKKWLGMD